MTSNTDELQQLRSCKHSCANCARKKMSLFAGLKKEDLEIVDRNRQSTIYNAGEIIFKEGAMPSSLICLSKGKIKITKQGIDGNEQIIALKKPVEYIGIEALFREGGHQNTAVALEESLICHIQKEQFFTLLKQNSEFAFRIMRSLSSELAEADLRLVNLTQKHMRGRMAEALLKVHKTYRNSKDEMSLNVELKRAELAAFANMSTSNAVRVLSAFAKENLLELKQRQIKIKDLDGLQKISVIPW